MPKNIGFENGISTIQDLTFNEAMKMFEMKNLDFGESQMKTLVLINVDGIYKLSLFIIRSMSSNY